MRLCHIVRAMVEVGEADSPGDGAYDLFDEVGTPDEIGKAIANSLKTLDFTPPHITVGANLFLKLTIKFCDPEVKH